MLFTLNCFFFVSVISLFTWVGVGGQAVCLCSGILPALQTDGALSFVLAHEIAHVLARHGSEKVGIAYIGTEMCT